MVTRLHKIVNLEDLEQYVYLTICEREELQLGAFPMTAQVLTRAGRPCGVFFCVHGPRATKFTAIWEAERNRVLFYGSQGERFGRVQLNGRPRLEQPLARRAAA